MSLDYQGKSYSREKAQSMLESLHLKSHLGALPRARHGPQTHNLLPGNLATFRRFQRVARDPTLTLLQVQAIYAPHLADHHTVSPFLNTPTWAPPSHDQWSPLLVLTYQPSCLMFYLTLSLVMPCGIWACCLRFWIPAAYRDVPS